MPRLGLSSLIGGTCPRQTAPVYVGKKRRALRSGRGGFTSIVPVSLAPQPGWIFPLS